MTMPAAAAAFLLALTLAHPAVTAPGHGVQAQKKCRHTIEAQKKCRHRP
jgi:hypothetical protein